ncbi:MAG: TIGR03087 family PEP-CTERM/XrtA system glycosyltransferase [Pseudomonadales bacterium]|nr:TIGR03087 family PEP-CTERM/XrtA system glycosyltransferase [Pseudomonadales bacterium]
MKETLLFLSHRIPYPPNKGDKIRSYHILKHLSQRYRIFLGTFVDDKDDWQYLEGLEQYVEEHHCFPLNPVWSQLKGVTALALGQPISNPYYYDKKLQRWADEIIKRENPEKLFLYSSSMAQYVMSPLYQNHRRVIDFVDIDSDKWRQYAEKKRGIMKWVYRREHRYLLDFEREVAVRFDSSIFVSDHEADLFKEMAPESQSKIEAVSNGVDLDYFSDTEHLVNPYPGDTPVLVFTGAMDYWANSDAVQWFCDTVFPLIRKSAKTAEFYIVGINPNSQVLQLGSREGVTVTGKVKDIRPYIHFAKVAVAPLQIARGIQNKVLEAMASETPVVATSAAMEGISIPENLHLLIQDIPEEFSRTVVALLESVESDAMGAKCRKAVEASYSWDACLQRLDSILEG